MYFISNRVYIHFYQHRHHSRLLSSVWTLFRLVGTLFQHLSNRLEQCSNPSQIGSNTVQTLFRLVGKVFEHFSDCLEHCWNTVWTLVNLIGTVFEHFLDWFKHCSNTFEIGWNTIGTLVRSVWTLFEQCSNTYYYDTGIRLIRTGEIHNYTCRQHVYFISHGLYIQQHVYLMFHRVYIFLSIWKYPYPSQTPFSWNLAKPHAKMLHLPRLMSCHGSTGSPSALMGGSKRGRDSSRGGRDSS